MATTEKILDKLRKMKAHAESAEAIGNLNEAQAFAEAMQRMMLEHDLSLTDLQFSEEMDEPVKINPVHYSQHGGARVVKARVRWMENLAAIVAQAHFCQILTESRSSAVSLIGRPSDALPAEFMIVTLTRLLDKMSHRAWWVEWEKRGGKASKQADRAVRGTMLGFRTGYLEAFTRRLRQRYNDERRAANHATLPAGSTSTALVRLNRKQLDVEDFVKAQHQNGSFVKSSALTRGLDRAGHAEGWRQGTKAADDVRLRSNAVEAGTRPSRGALPGR